MSERHKVIAAICVLSLMLGALALSLPGDVFGQMTIPTRTPVPSGGGGDGGSGGGGGSDNNNPPPTSESGGSGGSSPPATSVARATTAPPAALSTPTPTPFSFAPSATPNPAATEFVVVPGGQTAVPGAEYRPAGVAIVAFPVDSATYPQAETCGLPPTFTAEEAISVTGGPSAAYPTVGLLGAGEVRPIAGRAAFANWWLVQLDASGRMGWVSDDAGLVHGLAIRAPIVSAPELNGILPTPGGAPWVPTPSPLCAAPELAAGAVVDVEDSGEFSPPSGEPDLPEAAIVSTGQDQAGTALDSGDRTADPLLTELAASAPPLELPASGPRLPNLVPVAGAVLIVAAVLLGLYARRGRPGGPGE